MVTLTYEYKLRPTLAQAAMIEDWSERTHHCPECGYTAHRDVAAAQVVRQRGIAAVGHIVKKIGEGNV